MCMLGPQWKNFINQTYSCPRDWRLRDHIKESRITFKPNWGPPWSPSDHHRTIVLWGLKGTLIGFSSCRKTLVSSTANISCLQCKFDWFSEIKVFILLKFKQIFKFLLNLNLIKVIIIKIYILVHKNYYNFN